jgi:osmoprotectant transport system substrate-binding protein
MAMGRRPRLVIVLALAAVALAACAGDQPSRGVLSAVTTDDAITVGSFDFAESDLVAEVYSQALEHGGYRVTRAFGLGPRELVGPALSRGLVELVPEYAGTALQFASLGKIHPTGDVAATHAALVETLADGPLTALNAAPAQSANTFVVTRAVADTYGVRTLSDVTAVAPQLVFGGPPECGSRPLCLLGLKEVYGITFKQVVRLDAGGPVTRQALTTGAVDMALLFTSDPAIASGAFVEVADDRHMQPAENITPLVRRDVLSRFGPGVATVIDAVSEHLTTAALRQLNAALEGSPSGLAAIADQWLHAEGLQ